MQLQRAERQTTAGWNVETLQFLLRWSRSFGACVREDLEAAGGSSGVAPEKSSGSRGSAADAAGSQSGAAPEESSGSRASAAEVARPKRRGQRGGKHKDYYEKWFYVPPEKRRRQA